MAQQTLNDILNGDDEFGLLDVKPMAGKGISKQSTLEQEFEAINLFIDSHGYLPGETPGTAKSHPTEKVLQIRLRAYLADPAKCEALKAFDRHGLFTSENREKALSFEDILDSDDELLQSSADEIFTFKRAPMPKAKPDRISERKPCEEFDKFKPLLDACIADIETGRRTTRRFKNEQEIKAGEFFILNGVTVYVAEVKDPHTRNGKKNARLRLIFDNATEGENLLRSLATELYKDKNGRRVTDPDAGALYAHGFQEGQQEAYGVEQTASGLVYIVKSLSPDPRIRELDGGLFKIGFTTGTLEARIANAKAEPTFLMAPVHPVKSFTVSGMNIVKMENLIHLFFAEARLNIEMMGFGKPYKPREWFVLPLEVVEQAIKMLIDKTIIEHRYDHKAAKIIKKT